MADTATDSQPRGGTGLPGCIILFAILAVFGGLIVLYSFVGMKQHREIGKFTEDTPAELAIPEPSKEAVDAVEQKLFTLKAAASQNKAERILFTADDLNTLIATKEMAADFRGNTRIKQITPQGLAVEMSQPMRKSPLSRGYRYINAIFLFQPELRARTIAFKVMDILPEEGTLPQQFVSNYSSLDFFRLDPNNEVIKAYIPAISRIYVEGDQLVIETKVRSTDS